MTSCSKVAGACRSCDHWRVRTRVAEGSALGRVIACALLVTGIAVMHHLVVTGCSTAISGHEQAHDVHLPESSPAAPVDGVGEAPTDDAPAAALCLAVILGGWLITPFMRAWRVRRETAAHEGAACRDVVGVLARPPDLASLSVSRT